MSGPFCHISCRNFSDFVNTLECIPKRQSRSDTKEREDVWIYRGQRKSKWCLKTTLERACDRFGVVKSERPTIERRMIREFQRRLHHFTVSAPGEDALDEWMALMQHHGAPTRLLDFTYSPFVAAYFAFEGAECFSEVAIWAVNTDWCERELASRFPRLGAHYLSYQRYRTPEDFKAIFIKPQTQLVLSINPFRLNERLAYQRGAFLCPGNISVDFMQNLAAFAEQGDLDTKVIKFTIRTGDKGEIWDDALQQLDQMNINRITLFPGLDGFAQSFEPRIPSLFLKQRW